MTHQDGRRDDGDILLALGFRRDIGNPVPVAFQRRERQIIAQNRGHDGEPATASWSEGLGRVEGRTEVCVSPPIDTSLH